MEDDHSDDEGSEPLSTAGIRRQMHAKGYRAGFMSNVDDAVNEGYTAGFRDAALAGVEEGIAVAAEWCTERLAARSAAEAAAAATAATSAAAASTAAAPELARDGRAAAAPPKVPEW